MNHVMIYTQSKSYDSMLALIVGPSGVRALPVAAGTNESDHYF